MVFYMLIGCLQAQLMIDIGNEEVSPGDAVCIDFTVDNFTDIATFQLSMSWSPAVLQFDSVTNINFPAQENLIFGTTFVNIGQLTMAWNINPATLDGTLPDGTILYSLCFTVIGSENTMSTVSIQNIPTSIEIFDLNDNFITPEVNNGLITVGLAMRIVDTIITVSNCYSITNGSIDITPEGGQLPYSYSWTGPTGFSANTEDIMDLFAGTYHVTVQDASDPPFMTTGTFEVMGDFEAPTVVVADGGIITCDEPIANLNGMGSSVGSEFEYLWSPISGIVLTGDTTLLATVNEPGTYDLIINNTRNGCGDIASVTIGIDTVAPIANAGMGGELNCDNMNFELAATASMGDEYIYEWNFTTGNITMGENTLSPIVDEAGIYELIVTDTTNGCSGSSTVEITQNANVPSANAGTDTIINCTNLSIELDGSMSDMDDDLSYQWISLDANDIENPTSLNPIVSNAGTYQLVVTNTMSNCADSSTVFVAIDTIKPIVNAGSDSSLTCMSNELVLDATDGTDAGLAFVNLWSPSNGIIADSASLMPTINLPDTYSLMVTNMNNGCVGIDSVVIEIDTLQPLANAGEDITLTCLTDTIQLDASTSDQGSEYSYIWSSEGGIVSSESMSLMPLVIGMGDYILEVTNQNNSCTSMDTVGVFDNMNIPIADAGTGGELNCINPTITLDASASSGDNLSFNWSTENGQIISGNNSNMPVVDEPGTYVLVIQDSISACTDTASIDIVADTSLVDADAGIDQSTCTDTAQIIANLPNAATGIWTSNTSAIIDDPTAANTFVSNLTMGNNLFIWTLSTTDCADYDADTVVINVETIPIANDDIFEIPFGQSSTIDLDLVANDGVAIVSNWNIQILDQPSSGILATPENGIVSYTRDNNFGGELLFSYLLCNDFCPDYCDTANVVLNVIEPGLLDSLVDIANTITPNGDGINDQFVINELVDAIDQFPQNELVIINRWGDIVYSAQPYNNDWDGKNESGQDLPQGTYYYVLRLDIAKALIYRGDITIIR